MRLRLYQVEFTRRGDEWLARKGRHRVWIVRDERYSDMWRVVRPDGSLSDIVNRARAKDAAFGLVESLEFTNATR